MSKHVKSTTANAHQFLPILRVVINERLSIEKEEDAIGRDLGLGVVGGKGGRLTDGKCTEDDCKEYAKDIAKRLMYQVVSGKVDQEGTEPKDNGKEEEDDSLREAVG